MKQIPAITASVAYPMSGADTSTIPMTPSTSATMMRQIRSPGNANQRSAG